MTLRTDQTISNATMSQVGRGRPRVAVLYHQFPHYRAPVLRLLSQSEAYGYSFYGSLNDFSGIRAFTGDESIRIEPLNVVKTKRGFRISGIGKIIRSSFDAYIILGNPNIQATWLLAIWGRLTGKKVLFWTHGWLKRERGLQRSIRRLYYCLAHTVLVYGERAREIGRLEGFPEDRIRVIYNSLDYAESERILKKLESGTVQPLAKSLFTEPERPLLICTARLTDLCKLDLLIMAAATLSRRGTPVNVLLVGDGPARERLEVLARNLSVDVHFFGACYDESTVGQLIYEADATVSPGKIGLTAIHSLTYGTPAFTHGNMDRQMPEVEAIVPGETGGYFREGDADDLAEVLARWLLSNPDRTEVRAKCRATVAQKWNPENQRLLIEQALDDCPSGI